MSEHITRTTRSRGWTTCCPGCKKPGPIWNGHHLCVHCEGEKRPSPDPQGTPE